MLGEMAISDPARNELYNRLTDVLGQGPADTLMASLPAYDPGEIPTKADLQLHLDPIRFELEGLKADVSGLKAELSELKAEVSEVRGELKGDVSGLKAELKGEIKELRDEFNGFRGDVSLRFDAMQQRMDHLFLSLVAGVFVIVAAMVSIAIWG